MMERRKKERVEAVRMEPFMEEDLRASLACPASRNLPAPSVDAVNGSWS